MSEPRDREFVVIGNARCSLRVDLSTIVLFVARQRAHLLGETPPTVSPLAAEQPEPEPVARVRVHRTGALAGIAWSVAPVAPDEALPLLADGTLLFVAPPPAAAPGSVVDDVLGEVGRATEKFPTWPTDPLHALAVLGEEHGELTKAVLQLVYEPDKSSRDDVRTEAIQTAAMALRFVMSLERYKYLQGQQHQQDGAALAARRT